MKNKNQNMLKGIAILIVGILLGWLIFGGGSTKEPKDEHVGHDHSKETIWTCSMHPQIRQNKPGDCPICGMDLIPLEDESSGASYDPNGIEMSETSMKLAAIQTTIVKKQNPEKEIRLMGKVKPDERRMFSQTVHISGRIEKLYINYTGEKVSKGQKIASVYSPQLISAQKELFEMLNTPDVNPRLLEAARNKFKLWKFTEEQINELESNGELKTEFDILSDHSGFVFKRNVALGDHVMEGKSLFHIVDLNNVWVMLEAYETDLPWIKKGDEVSLEMEAFPGKYHEAKIDYIDPFINPKTRVTSIRVNLKNTNQSLKPEMFANAIIQAKLPVDEPSILIPKSAVLWTGKRAIIYLKIPSTATPVFLMREITLGVSTGDSYLVENGLEEGDEIAVNGVFKIDAAAQLAGKKSMMNPEGGPISTGHDHGGSHNTKPQNKVAEQKKDISPIDVADKFKTQLGNVVSHYLLVKDNLVEGDFIKANKSARQMINVLNKVDMKLLKGDVHVTWMEYHDEIENSTNAFIKAQDIIGQRKQFSKISHYLNLAVQTYGINTNENKTLYLDFCPMAAEDGAYWLSHDKEIRNPYFGHKMLKCGEIKKTLTK